jgi:hypothetical protein
MADHYFEPNPAAECERCEHTVAAHPVPPALDGQTIRAEVIEFIRSIAEHDRFIAFRELADADDEQAELHALQFDSEVLRDIEAKAKALLAKLIAQGEKI